MNEFEQRVMLHAMLDGVPAQAEPHELSLHQHVLSARLHHRARALARSLLDRMGDGHAHPQTHPWDSRLDEHLLWPARAMVRSRTTALERSLAELSFRSRQPLRFIRGHRTVHYHGEPFDVATSRPVVRGSFQPADSYLALQLLREVTGSTPTALTRPRVTVVPGFVVLELQWDDFLQSLGVVHIDQQSGHRPTSLRGRQVDFAATHAGATALGHLAHGPILIATRDHGGELLAHVLLDELHRELTGSPTHQSPLPTPAQLVANPAHSRALPTVGSTRSTIAQLTDANLRHRLSHLPSACRLELPLALHDLGFSAHDWVPLAPTVSLPPRFELAATTYLASLMASRAAADLVGSDHAAVRSLAVSHHSPIHQLERLEHGSGVTDPHLARYRGILHHAGQRFSPRLLTDLYHRTIDHERDFTAKPLTHHPVRLQFWHGPIHPVN